MITALEAAEYLKLRISTKRNLLQKIDENGTVFRERIIGLNDALLEVEKLCEELLPPAPAVDPSSFFSSPSTEKP